VKDVSIRECARHGRDGILELDQLWSDEGFAYGASLMRNEMPSHWYEAYERGRPGYPPEVVAAPGLESSAAVLELGAGTGKLTRLLVSSFARVSAVEPDAQMRRRLVASFPQVEVVPGSAEEISVGDASVDAVFAAQSFHTFDQGRAIAEIARVLRPRGTVVLLWNVSAGPASPSIAAVHELLDEHWPKGWDPIDLGLSYASRDWPDEWKQLFDKSAFEELMETRFSNRQSVDKEALVAFFGSMGWIAELPDERRIPLLDQVKSLLAASMYDLPWETRVYWARRGPTS
jgi:ubiquinone/menaquinone biosynthesis C-methylase UbiE